LFFLLSSRQILVCVVISANIGPERTHFGSLLWREVGTSSANEMPDPLIGHLVVPTNPGLTFRWRTHFYCLAKLILGVVNCNF
jgi:hypothetical protein